MQSHSRQLRCCQHLFRQAMRRIENSFSRTVRPDTRKRAAFLPEKPLLVFEHAFSPPAPLMLEAKVCDANLRAAEPKAFEGQKAHCGRRPALQHSASPVLEQKLVARASGGGAEGFRRTKGSTAGRLPAPAHSASPMFEAKVCDANLRRRS